jgi:hypothetical protein
MVERNDPRSCEIGDYLTETSVMGLEPFRGQTMVAGFVASRSNPGEQSPGSQPSESLWIFVRQEVEHEDRSSSHVWVRSE